MFLLLMMMFQNFEKTELDWRAAREQDLRSNESWLNVVGLFWLKDGDSSFGSSLDNDIILPAHSTVEFAGTFKFQEGKVSYQMNRGQLAKIDDRIANSGELKAGQVLSHNHLRMFLIQRDGRWALRVRDLRAGGFMHFKQLDFYRPKEKYQVEATFEPFDPPRALKIQTVINTEIEMLVPGKLKFQLEGKDFELLPTLESPDDNEFFIMLKDLTSGPTTYAGGRFLYAELPKDGKVILNFNRAINPPCGYTNFATCPLPPMENWLPIPIEAGERNYPGHAK